ncbi:MAG: hypothetical protein IPL28_21510 [Chloroflexi bacterium]|nr:hypothetical protein [Chloroflexota bacterium]
MHQLVQTVYRDQMGEGEAREWIVAVGQWLAKVYRFDYYEMETWPAAVVVAPSASGRGFGGAMGWSRENQRVDQYGWPFTCNMMAIAGSKGVL